MKKHCKSIRIFAFFLVIVFAYCAAMCLAFAPAVTVARADGTDTAAIASGELRIHFIDCGQADACVIQLPDGKNMLIDAGDSSSSSYNLVTTYLNDVVNIDKLDYFIMTHADSDHIGGVTHVLEGLELGTVYRPSQICSADGYTDPALSGTGKEGIPYDTTNVPNSNKQGTATYRNALTYCYENADAVVVTDPANDEINCITNSVTVNGKTQTYTFDFYSPVDPPYSDNNDYSPIMVLSYAGRNIVLSGDAEAKNEADFVAKVKSSADTDARYDRFRTNDFDADIIKLGHHGSSTSSSEAYLSLMCSVEEWRANVYTVISCGTGNSYGHPHHEILQRLMDMKFSALRIERTDLFGSIRFDIESDGTMTRWRDHNYTDIGGKEYAEDDSVTISAVLTSVDRTTNARKTVEDNGVRPTVKNGSGLISHGGSSFWNFLLNLPTYALVLLIIAVVVGIALIVLLIVAINNNKRKKRRAGGSRRK